MNSEIIIQFKWYELKRFNLGSIYDINYWLVKEVSKNNYNSILYNLDKLKDFLDYSYKIDYNCIVMLINYSIRRNISPSNKDPPKIFIL